MSNLTVIFLTNNQLPEEWTKYHYEKLLEAIGDANLITVSRKPMPGVNIIQTEPKSGSNIYWQMLKACRIATTPYIAIAEDDTLYPKEHFLYRPPMDTFAYNKHRWSLFTWGEPIYSCRNRLCNKVLICSRELAIEALEERFNKYPEGISDKIIGELGRGMVERNLKVKERKSEEFHTSIGVVGFDHIFSYDEKQQNHRKRLGWIRALDIPYWGKSSELIKHFK